MYTSTKSEHVFFLLPASAYLEAYIMVKLSPRVFINVHQASGVQ